MDEIAFPVQFLVSDNAFFNLSAFICQQKIILSHLSKLMYSIFFYIKIFMISFKNIEKSKGISVDSQHLPHYHTLTLTLNNKNYYKDKKISRAWYHLISHIEWLISVFLLEINVLLLLSIFILFLFLFFTIQQQHLINAFLNGVFNQSTDTFSIATAKGIATNVSIKKWIDRIRCGAIRQM